MMCGMRSRSGSPSYVLGDDGEIEIAECRK
jgi:hypothetical protein